MSARGFGSPGRPRPLRGIMVAAVLGGPALLAVGACADRGGVAEGATLTLAPSGASNPTVATGPDGATTYVAWVSGREGEPGDVLLTMVPWDGTAAEPVRVNDVPGDATAHLQAPAQVAVGPEGNVYMAWQNNTVIEGRRFPASDLRFARSVDGGRTFSPAVTINDDVDGPPASHTFHNLTVTRDGTVVLSWLDGREDAHGGHAGMDMEMSEGPGPSVRVAVSRDGGATFEPSVVVDRETCPCCRTALAAGPDGTLYVAWRKIFDGDVRDVVVARSTDGGRSWEAPVKVADDGWVFPGCPHAGPALAVGSEGALHVAWYTGREDGAGLYHVVSRDRGRSFGPAEPLLAGGWVPPSQVALAPGAGGAIWMAWEDRRGEQPTFHLARTSEEGSWNDDGSEVLSGSNPAFSAGVRGAVVAWLEGEAVRMRVLGTG